MHFIIRTCEDIDCNTVIAYSSRGLNFLFFHFFFYNKKASLVQYSGLGPATKLCNLNSGKNSCMAQFWSSVVHGINLEKLTMSPSTARSRDCQTLLLCPQRLDCKVNLSPVSL